MYDTEFDEALIEALYLAAGDHGQWPAFLKRAIKLFDAQLALLCVTEAGSERGKRQILFEPEQRATVPSEALRINLENLIALTTTIGQDFESHCITVVVEGPRAFGLSLVRDATQPAFAAESRERLLNIMPFMRQVVNAPLARPVDTINLAMLDAINAIAVPAFMLDDAGDIGFCNAVAESFLTSQNEIVRRDSGLAFCDSNVQEAFDAAQNTFAGEGAVSQVAPVEIVISRPPSLPFLMVMVPIQTALSTRRRLTTAVYIIEAGIKLMPGAGTARLCAFYGLTTAEGEIALLILSGRNAADIAAQRGVSLHTVRAQIKQILDKTQSRSQADLFRLQGLFNI